MTVSEKPEKPDSILTAAELRDRYPSPNDEYFGQHPFWTIGEWQNDVGSGGQRYCDTISGYWDWVVDRIDEHEDDEDS